MPTDVIAWPPVGVVGSMWTLAAPVQRSRSMLTGARHVSRWGRARVMAALSVSALSINRSGAGYSEMLIRYLDGGANLVRLNSYPINWYLDARALDPIRSSRLLNWTSNGPLSWQTAGQPLLWFSGAVLTGVASGNEIEVSGLPPNKLVARPAEFVQVFSELSLSNGPMAQVVTEAFSDASGTATLRLVGALPPGNYQRVNIGASESRVFEVTEMPSAMQGLGGNWQYDWRFAEVFADEVGGFNEVNPW